MINQLLSGLCEAIWVTYLGVTNLIGFNRFCAMYFSADRYQKIFSQKIVNTILAVLFAYEMLIFLACQIPELNLLFSLKDYNFHFTSKISKPAILKIFATYDGYWLMTNIFLTALWYILVYAKVKKQVLTFIVIFRL